jgi:hypothetical protein
MVSKFINNLTIGKTMGKKGQVTIFIIIAIVIVGAAILFFALTDVGRGIVNTVIPGGGSTVLSVEEELEKCVFEDSKFDSDIELVLSKGGDPESNFFFLHEGIEFRYLCYAGEFYEPCINQEPLLIQKVEAEIQKTINPIVASCIRDLEEEFGEGNNRGSSLKSTVDLADGNIKIKIDYPLTIKQGGSSRTINGFDIKKESEVYQILSVSTSIVSYETAYGDSDPVAYMSVYPNTRVEKLKQSEGTTLYIVSDRLTNERFNFATKSYAVPPGYRF